MMYAEFFISAVLTSIRYHGNRFKYPPSSKRQPKRCNVASKPELGTMVQADVTMKCLFSGVSPAFGGGGCLVWCFLFIWYQPGNAVTVNFAV